MTQTMPASPQKMPTKAIAVVEIGDSVEEDQNGEDEDEEGLGKGEVELFDEADGYALRGGFFELFGVDL